MNQGVIAMRKIRYIHLSKIGREILGELKRHFIYNSEIPSATKLAEKINMSERKVMYHYNIYLQKQILVKVGCGKYRFSRVPYTLDNDLY